MHSYQNIGNLIGYEDVHICRICGKSAIWQYCTAVQIRGEKMADSQNPPGNQLKRHVLVWVTQTLLIKAWFPPLRLTYSHVYSYENEKIILLVGTLRIISKRILNFSCNYSFFLSRIISKRVDIILTIFS